MVLQMYFCFSSLNFEFCFTVLWNNSIFIIKSKAGDKKWKFTTDCEKSNIETACTSYILSVYNVIVSDTVD